MRAQGLRLRSGRVVHAQLHVSPAQTLAEEPLVRRKLGTARQIPQTMSQREKKKLG